MSQEESHQNAALDDIFLLEINSVTDKFPSYMSSDTLIKIICHQPLERELDRS